MLTWSKSLQRKPIFRIHTRLVPGKNASAAAAFSAPQSREAQLSPNNDLTGYAIRPHI